MWKENLNPYIKELQFGSDRIQTIIVDTKPKICIINAYMPVNKNKSVEEYLQMLTIIEENIAITKDCTHIILGDFNASMKRNNNTH